MTQTEFIPIKDATATLKGSIKAIVTKESDLKAGTTNGKDWTKRSFTLEDSSGSIEITTWNDDTKKFKVGYSYEIINPWWKEYEGKPQLDLGKYAQVTVVGSENTPTEATQPQEYTSPTPSPTSSIKGQVAGMKAHDNCWAVAIEEAKKVYPVENIQIPDSDKIRDLYLKDRMILAQVYYKKLMDFEIHGAKK